MCLTTRVYGNRLSHLLYKDEMLSVGTFWDARSSTVSPRIDASFARNGAPVLGEHAVHFKMFLIHVLRC